MEHQPVKKSAITRAIIVAAGVTVAGPAMAETYVGSTVENRILVGFRVNDAAAGAHLPEGWVPLTLPRGPLAGTNLVLVLMDRHLVTEADGAPDASASPRAAAFLTYAVSAEVEGPRAFITAVYETPPMADTYSNSHAATISHRSTTEGSDGTTSMRSDSWMITAEAGGEITFDLAYEVGTPVWAAGQESLPYSASEPDFHRIYRYDQLADLAMNTAIGRELPGEVSYSVTVSEFAAAFDGTEALVAVINIPVYVREVYLP